MRSFHRSRHALAHVDEGAQRCAEVRRPRLPHVSDDDKVRPAHEEVPGEELLRRQEVRSPL